MDLPPASAAAGGGPLPEAGAWTRAATAVAALGAIGAELGLMAACVGGLASLPSLLLAHLAVSAALVGAAVMLYRRGGRSPTFLLLVVCTAGLGPLGAVGGGLSAGLRWVFARQATPFEQWHASLFPKMDASPIQALYERIVLRGGGPATRSTVAPFQDVMALGTVQQKQAVVTMIADEFQLAFAPALRSALNDAEPSIRVQAATASARIENRFLERSMALEKRHAAAPDDPDTLLALARHHDEYANTGLLDAARARTERRRALDYYERVERCRPGDPGDLGVAEAVGRLLLRLDLPQRALTHLKAEVERGEASPLTLALLLECLYRLHRLAALRSAAAVSWRRIAASDLPGEVREAARLWAGVAPAGRDAA